uniref:hypothetical protein n=1 Tax=Serratia TaxID=613 RepID=UPI001F4C4ABF|nr:MULTISPECIES: hypothetical protein [Serratia]ULG12133.1 hypothetical protein D1p2_00019 [Serratia entomophila]ULG12330.1 hypothetical protein M3p_00032 [Serratia entomophila]ULG12348.1 hypothetical protein M3p_00052 [Serratia entomophila]ULG15960.1 hypothetical protein 591p_00109 [Serratia proteamaculans]ULG18442.1 hypothetical protein Man4p_00125 [Serratia proteamaculans]
MISNTNGLTNVRIRSFTIEEMSERFYANGRHQCHIRISVFKVGLNSSNWQEVKVPLSQREIASIRPVNLSSSLNNSDLLLPHQWSSSPLRNIYDLGLIISTAVSQPIERWRTADKVQEIRNLSRAQLEDASWSDGNAASCAECQYNDNSVAEVKNSEATELFNSNNVPDIFDFYISSFATGTQQLMATMKFEELNDVRAVTNIRTLTTNMSDNHGNIFNSSIRLAAIQPVIINNITPVLTTLQDRRENVTKWDVHHQTITLYTWQLPFNLRSMSRSSGNVTRRFYALGNTQENNRFLTSGRCFSVGTSRVNARDNVRPGTGCVWDFGYSVTVSNRQICADALQVTGCSWTSQMSSGTHDIWLIDNFGTEHRFRISPSDTGRTLTLNRIGI